MEHLLQPGWDVREAPDEIPSSYLVHGAWPYGTLAADAPVSARLAQAIARRLQDAVTSRRLSDRELAEAAGVSHPPIGRVLNGNGLPDARTILLLEAALQRPMWPADLHQHLHAANSTSEPPPDTRPPDQEPPLPEQPVQPVTTPAMRAILGRMADGRTQTEIADELGIVVRTIRKRLAPLYEALGIPAGDTFRLGLWWATADERHHS